jgi:hypothetical protein
MDGRLAIILATPVELARVRFDVSIRVRHFERSAARTVHTRPVSFAGGWRVNVGIEAPTTRRPAATTFSAVDRSNKASIGSREPARGRGPGGREATPIGHSQDEVGAARPPKISTIMDLASPNCVDHDVNFMIDAILGVAGVRA